MANITSKGLNALSHFNNSRVSRAMDEPIYKNLWSVEIQLPEGVGATVESTNILLEGVRKITGLDTTKVPGVAQQRYKSADRSFAGAGPETTFLEVGLDFDVNVQRSNGKPSMTQLKLLRKWCDLVYDPLTGRQGLKIDYTAPQMVITLHDKAMNPLWMWTLYDVFPMSNITPMELDYDQKTELYKVTDFKLRCDRWDEVMA